MIGVYNEQRTAHALAWLLHRGGPMPVYKLLRILYCAERLSLRQYAEPLTGDEIMATGVGPVQVHTSAILNGTGKGAVDGIAAWVTQDGERLCRLRAPIAGAEDIEQVLVHLSDSDVECLKEASEILARYSVYTLASMALIGALPEWNARQPFGARIPLARILEALQYSPAQVESIIDKHREREALAVALAA
ncbi:hypothetical protein LMG26857_03607 [Achromobacter anxifer]|uniref:type II toxin-antitoxin system antitoxin SocA domain-containing protein n=1 Tax=Achromobacter anxifer TaxID=1287737 RepID=UPI00155B484B|nr:type II toxin-antitoxin system antitoxin SocA domain-containing protein [Achromobacter anxifer]CAB5514548.1 hypothetical protein LMG26857_03607 [Achromobacter anxifer]